MQTDFNEAALTLVLDELVEEAGLPRAGAADHQELKQEVCRQRKGKEVEINIDRLLCSDHKQTRQRAARCVIRGLVLPSRVVGRRSATATNMEAFVTPRVIGCRTEGCPTDDELF
ncbi:hypothetical protein EYF80_034962 [Liparis tanakae]|uniref:Uncharacterized protein n=1 Tax=Liparis tanakae TaxID=230148 RepID=A0A4Z2GPZ3_9TELE|nr:hypothetical protein EYF80_034962 [Liparis tanakae]